jgi:hypothetical protein
VGLRDKSRDWKTCHGSSTHYMEMLSRSQGPHRENVSSVTKDGGPCCLVGPVDVTHTPSAYLMRVSESGVPLLSAGVLGKWAGNLC